MQPSSIITLLAAAAITTATAIPSKACPASTCAQNQKLACCNSVGFSVVGAECSLLSVLGGNCKGNVQCCDVKQNGKINLVNLCVPVAL